MSRVRVPRPARPNGRGAPGRAAPPPAVADLLSRRGWGVVEQGEEEGRLDVAARRWVVSDGTGSYLDVGLVVVPPEPAARALLVERLALLRSVDDEHLAGVEEIVEAGADGLAVVSRRPAGGGLGLLLACRGPFGAGEAVTLLVPLAHALAALHRVGLTYGGVGVPDVLVGPQGRATLRAPLDLCALPPADDVRSLAELVGGLLTPLPVAPVGAGTYGEPPDGADGADGADGREVSLAALHAELAAARRADPRARPEVGTLAALCYEAAPATAIVMPDGARLAAAALAAGPGPAPVRGYAPPVVGDGAIDDTVARSPVTTRAESRRDPVGRHGPQRTRALGSRARGERRSPSAGSGRSPGLVAGTVLLVCTVLVGGGLLARQSLVAPREAPWAPHREAQTAGSAQGDPTRRPDDPAGAAAELTQRRIDLLTGEREPSEVLVPGSPAESVDAELLARVRTSGLVVEGARAVVDGARQVEPGTGGTPPVPGSAPTEEAEVEVTYSVTAHTQRAADGSVTSVPAAPATTALLTLRWTEAGWRVSDVA